MTRLPRALDRWSRELAPLPRTVALAIGPWLGRLALAIGPWSDATRPGGEPDGYADLGRRGSYERLLMSEWLLADEAPDEFVRRAASHEHLFFAPSLRSSSGRRRAIVLFDSGPSQLGAPRIAHFAIMLVLARRAIDAGARFEWGVLQSPEAGLSQSTDAASVRALLASRTASEPTIEHVETWRERLGVDVRDAWIVGGRRAIASCPDARSSILVDDPLEIDRHALDVTIEDGSRHARIELALPNDATCTRLVRDPYRDDAPPSLARVRIDGSTRISLPGDGRRLVLTRPGGLLSWGLPNSPHATPSSPRALELGSGETLVAVGQRGRRIHAVAVRANGQVVLHRPPWVNDGRAVVVGEPEPALARIALLEAKFPLGHAVVHVLADDPLDADLTFHDGHERLYSFRASRADVSPLVHVGVIAMTPGHDGAWVVTRTITPATTTVGVIQRDGTFRQLVTHQGLASPRAWFAAFEGEHAVAAYALDIDLRTIRIVERKSGRTTELHAPTGTRVLGVHHEASGDASEGPALVLLEADERTISVVGRRGPRTTLRSSGPIVDACVAARYGMVAWRTVDGVVEVGSFERGAPLLRLVDGEGAP